jgi:hypothetical protein
LEGVIPPEQLGIPESERAEWQQTIQQAFSAYEQSLTTWENLALKHPQVIRIPSDLMQDSTEKAARQRNRILRNYAFDRARYFIPSAAATNVMLVMSARGWVQLCQYLLSHPLPEPRDLGRLIKAELSLVTPRLVKHAEPKDSTIAGILEELQVAKAIASIAEGKTHSSSDEQVEKGGAFLELLSPKDVKESDIAGALAQHDNRYAWLGSALRRTAVRFGWKAVSFAEIRDLNRHRTGTKYCPFVPRGFYAALDQTIGSCGLKDSNQLESLVNWGVTVSELSKGMLAQGKWHYVYSTLLGTEFEFEHTTTADKFVYEAELRTGTGAHYRYARHLRDVLALWYEKFPQTKGMILEGSAEPE